MEPLFDLEGRTVCLSPRTPLEVLVDALLRMHAGDDWQSPITLYLGFSSREPGWLGAMEALQLCDVLQGLRSEIHTIGTGLVQGFEPLILAAGTRGNRFLLRNSLIRVGPLMLLDVPLPGTGFGLHAGNKAVSLRAQAQDILFARMHRLAADLAINPAAWESDQLLTAEQALRMGLADRLSPVRPQLPEYSRRQCHEPTITPN